MIYATVIPFNSLADPTDADAVHVATMGLYRAATLPGEVGARRAGANILWQVTAEGVLVTSDLPATDVPAGASTYTFDETVRAGEQVRFTATVDAVARVRGRDTPVSDVGAWFLRKTDGALEGVTIEEVTFAPVRRRGGGLSQTTIEGTATVADPAAVTSYIQEGLGRSKAFGCGMFRLS